MLPEICHRRSLAERRWIEIPRADASVVEGTAFFSLCKGSGRNFDCNFGYRWLSLSPKRKIDKEIETLISLLSWLFDLFDHGIPPTWLEQPTGYVDLHAFIIRPPRTCPGLSGGRPTSDQMSVTSTLVALSDDRLVITDFCLPPPPPSAGPAAGSASAPARSKSRRRRVRSRMGTRSRESSRIA